jgi:hypothetical protein
MAIAYKDSYSDPPRKRRRERRERNKMAAPLLVAIAAVVGLLWLGPETTSRLENAVTELLRLPGN